MDLWVCTQQVVWIDLLAQLLGMDRQAYSSLSFSLCKGHELLLQATCH